MVTVNLEQRARELLAAEYERDGRPSDADFVNLGLPICDADIRALRAIVAALRQRPAPVVDDAMVDRARAAFRMDVWPRDAMRDALTAALSRTHDVETTGVLRGNADLVPAQHAHLMPQPENNHEHY